MNLYRLNLNLLIALDVLLSEKNVTLAAKKLFITQAAMSNNLQQLRELFHDDLLIRQKNAMLPTSYAKALQPKLHQVLQEMRTIVESGQRFDPQTSERVFKIGMTDYMAAIILPSLIPYIKELAPYIKIAVVSVYHLNDPVAFETGQYEIGIGKIFKTTSRIKKQLLMKDVGVCVINRRHPLANKKKITLNDYLSYQHVAVKLDNPNNALIIDADLKKLGVSRDIYVSLPFVVPIFKIIEQSENLIATMIRSMTVLYDKHHDFIVKPLPFKISDIDIFLAWHHSHENDLGHQWLREQILTIASRL